MDSNKFKDIAENIINSMPELFLKNLDNVFVEISDYPTAEVVESMNMDKYSILGLYQGIPLSKRGVWYGVFPTIPDKITLFQKNIEANCKNEQEIYECIREVIYHEFGHYFGMNEKEIKSAMND